MIRASGWFIVVEREDFRESGQAPITKWVFVPESTMAAGGVNNGYCLACKRIGPSQFGKPGEIAVARGEFTDVLNAESG